MLIAEHLKKKKITQAEFAVKLGCSTAFVNSLINGKNTDIKISLVRRISAETKISESKLITELLSFKGDESGGPATKRS